MLEGHAAVEAVLATLVDHEVSLHTPEDRLRTAFENQGRLTTASLETADIVHAPTPTGGRVRKMNRGTLTEPSDGGTIVYEVDRLTADPDGAPDTTLTLTGPGIQGRRQLSVHGFPASEAGALSDAQSPYPRGVEAILASPDRIVALPRSVSLEVV